ncbi:MBL fold metallo-hydrolase [Oscillospiraceae bacterium OttesenSCG-928-F05]|nr:MBL fold metallo-hydrolase [Oscillospiraceae bacterium OttesenSCG-928-F05]
MLPDGEIEVYYFDVGQADCALVRCGGETMLIDAGEVGQGQLIQGYLDELGVDQLDYLVATHPHSDHIGSMAYIASTFEIGRLLMPDVAHTTRAFRDLMDVIEGKDLDVDFPAPGDTYRLGAAEMTILAPQKDYGSELNNWSLVLTIRFGSHTFLFTGDAEAESEADQLRAGADVDADVIKVPHHGSNTSSSTEYIAAVSPGYAVISVGTGNSYGHPTSDVLDVYEQIGAAIYRTDLHGTVIVISDGSDIAVKTSKTDVLSNSSPPEPTSSETVSAEIYIGNRSTKKFHLPSCGTLPAEQNRVSFSSRDDAISAGYVACKNCAP